MHYNVGTIIKKYKKAKKKTYNRHLKSTINLITKKYGKNCKLSFIWFEIKICE